MEEYLDTVINCQRILDVEPVEGEDAVMVKLLDTDGREVGIKMSWLELDTLKAKAVFAIAWGRFAE